MFALMTYLALNLPGDPKSFGCIPVDSNNCITNSGAPDYIPEYKVSISCNNYGYGVDDRCRSGRCGWTVYPHVGMLKNNDGELQECKITEVKKLGAE